MTKRKFTGRLRRPTVNKQTQTIGVYRIPRLNTLRKSALGMTEAYMKGHIHSFSRWTDEFNAFNHSNWAVTPVADTIDTTQWKFTTPAAAGISLASLAFRLKDVQNHSEFDNLFDYFRINAVKLHFSFLYDNSVYADQLQSPQMYIVKDYDDHAVPSGVAELIQYSNCKEVQIFNKGRGVVKVYLKPRVMNPTTLEQQPRNRRPWIDMAGNNSVNYYGCKFAIVNRHATPIAIYVRAKYYFQCKGQR